MPINRSRKFSTGAIILFRGTTPIYEKYAEVFLRSLFENECHTYLIHESWSDLNSQLSELCTKAFPTNMNDYTALKERCQNIIQNHSVTKIIAFHELDTFEAAKLREELNISGLLPEDAILFRNKNAMHQRAKELGVNTPPCVLPLTKQCIEKFVESEQFPIVIKPFDGMGCKDTYKVTNTLELENVWAQIRNDRQSYRVEKFVHGEHYCIDAIFHDGEVKFESLAKYTYNIIDYKDTEEKPGLITINKDRTEAQSHILETNRKLMHGFNLKTGITHNEFFLTEDGDVYLGECAARFGGGPIVSILTYASGMNVIDIWAKAELGKPQTERWTNDITVGAEYLTTHQYGEVKYVSDVQALSELTEVLEAEIWTKVGDVIQPPTDCSQVQGFYVSYGDSEHNVHTDFKRIRALFSIETDTPC
ncbi:ATP-grasp domain-containing protein [Vibrio sp. S9_S30]|uniref:ATP-grasp domain-containing protein n=1 Tax=Vibrio sp. S9_S30 TaxID=2720226 RepID=UPI00167FF641|nr:ATP-grasp domain-containing protein [Vibrio sp. S9_S30]MBD1557781.1 ATP-grasp domain-containing protein [Vibrio sp. S9_S30]